MKRLLFLLFILFFSNAAASSSNLYNYITSTNNFFDEKNTSVKVFENSIQRLADGIGFTKDIRVNLPYRNGSLNIYILNLKSETYSFSKKFPKSFGKILNSLNNNAIAIPPNVIFFDYEYLKKIYVNAFYDVTMILQNTETGDNFSQELSLNNNLMSILSDYHRIRNFRFFKGMTDKKDLEWIDFTFNSDIDTFEETLKIINMTHMENYLSASLAPIFYHELAHIQKNESGQLFDDLFGKSLDYINKKFTNAFIGNIKNIEDEADAFAMKKIDAYFAWINKNKIKPEDIEKLKNKISLPTNFPFENANELLAASAYYILSRAEEIKQVDIESLSLISTAKFFRDDIITETFQGVRPINVENLIFSFDHKNCDYDSGHQIEFNLADDINHINRGFLPILTKGEWENIRTRFLSHIKNGTHSHNFYRSSNFIRPILNNKQPKESDISHWDIGEDIFDSLFLNKPSLLEPTSKNKTSIKTKDLINKIEKNINFENAVTCKQLKCLVGTIKNKKIEDDVIFIEIISTQDDFVVYARLSYLSNYFPRAFLSKNDLSEKELSQINSWAKNSATTVRFILNASNELLSYDEVGRGYNSILMRNILNRFKLPSSNKDVANDFDDYDILANKENSPNLNKFLKFRYNVSHCNAASDTLKTKNNANIYLRTLTPGPDQWVSIEIQPTNTQW